MINSIIGLMNSGKTLYMVYRLFIEYLNGKTIITNLDLAFPHFKINKDFMIKLGEEQPVLENVAFGLDEFWIWFDARKSAKNTIVTYFFNQSSKDDTQIFLTAQHNDQNDKRIRTNLHNLSQCSRAVVMNGKIKEIDAENRFLPNWVQNILYIKVTNHKRMNIGYYTDLIPERPFYLKAKPFFNLYNTKQKVSAI